MIRELELADDRYGLIVIFSGFVAAPSPRIRTTSASVGAATATFGNVQRTPKIVPSEDFALQFLAAHAKQDLARLRPKSLRRPESTS